MKELDYIRYEKTENGEWHRAFAGKDGEEFELTGNWNYGMPNRILRYNGEDYKFKEIINPEIMFESLDFFDDDIAELPKNSKDIESYEKNRITNNSKTKWNDGKSTFIYILLIIGLTLAIFPMILE